MFLLVNPSVRMLASLVTTVTVTLDATSGDTTCHHQQQAALVDAINAKVGISNLGLRFYLNAAGVITVTGRQKRSKRHFLNVWICYRWRGNPHRWTASTTTSAGDATAIPFGVMVERSSATKAVGTAAIGSAVGSGTYTAQVSTITAEGGDITLASGDVLYATITGDLDGTGVKSYSAQDRLSGPTQQQRSPRLSQPSTAFSQRTASLLLLTATTSPLQQRLLDLVL